MIKTLKTLFKQDREKFIVPKSVQAVIPLKTMWEDGIFLVGRNKYAKTFKFEDINYAVASREDKEAMFLEYSELLNALDSGATTKITINNRRLNKADFEQTILIPMAEDDLDKYRREYNKMLLDKATGANSTVQDKYVTVSVCKKNIEEARNYFARVGADLIGHFNRLGSKCTELDANDKLRIFHDFYRTGEETAFSFDMAQTMRKGHDFKDYICPDSFEFEKDYFKMGNRYGRVIFLREYAAYIKDSMVAELCELNRNMMLSVDVVPVPTDEAIREVENRLLGVETNIANWQRKQNQNNNFSAVIPYDLEQQGKESKEFLDDLTTRDQRMMLAVLTMVHTADAKEQLDNDTEAAEPEKEPPRDKDTPVSEGEDILAKYKELYLQNEDMVGWIAIDGTGINYPVMQSKNNPNFYLKHSFEKEYSDLGVPYIQEDCDILTSDNLVIYGHHIKGGRMFGALEDYKSKNFYEKHKTIQFDTLTEQAQYEIIAVFKTVAYSSQGYRYYDFVNAENEKEFDAFVGKCKELALYDTGVTAQYGDRLITLSTCEYSAQNGRLVVVAKKVN